MDNNTTMVVIEALTTITSIATAAFAYYTNRRTKRMEESQKNIALGIMRIGTRNDTMQGREKPLQFRQD